MAEWNGKQKLAVELAKAELQQWRAAHDTYIGARSNMQAAIRKAVEAGVSQSDLARELDWPRQRVNLILAG